LQWEKVMIPFKVEVDYVKTQLNSYRNELKGDKGFGVDGWVQASSFCLEHDTNLEEGMEWADRAVSFKKDFNTLTNSALLHSKFGHAAKSDSLIKEALPMGSMQELHQYGRQLLGMKKNAQALEVFKFNAKKHPKEFTTSVGLARGYSATGDYKNALVSAKAALPLAPNEPNKKAVADMITKLENQKDIN
jgi:hypothetical protein